MKNICFVATTPFVVNAFLLGHLHALADHYRVTLCVNVDDYPMSRQLDPRIRVVNIDLRRKISLWHDLRAAWALLRLFGREDFDAVHSITPKAGLLAMLVAALATVPRRYHTFTGQVWANRSGLGRFFFKQVDRLIVALASRVFADSYSQCQFLEAEGVVAAGQVSVLGAGSICGVDPRRFCPNPGVRAATRSELGTASEDPVLLFVGRVARDKGVFDLVHAFKRLVAEKERAVLWVVGPDEDGLASELKRLAAPYTHRTRWVGPTFAPERYMAAADILVLPSYREGFGMVIVEAAACGVPAVAYRIDGVTDAVEEGVTGRLVAKGDVDELAVAMHALLEDRAVCSRLGRQARERAERHFSNVSVTTAWSGFYARALASGGRK